MYSLGPEQEAKLSAGKTAICPWPECVSDNFSMVEMS